MEQNRLMGYAIVFGPRTLLRTWGTRPISLAVIAEKEAAHALVCGQSFWKNVRTKRTMRTKSRLVPVVHWGLGAILGRLVAKKV
jgi:hypothetical protein